MKRIKIPDLKALVRTQCVNAVKAPKQSKCAGNWSCKYYYHLYCRYFL